MRVSQETINQEIDSAMRDLKALNILVTPKAVYERLAFLYDVVRVYKDPVSQRTACAIVAAMDDVLEYHPELLVSLKA